MNNYFVLQHGLNDPQNWFNSDFESENGENSENPSLYCHLLNL